MVSDPSRNTYIYHVLSLALTFGNIFKTQSILRPLHTDYICQLFNSSSQMQYIFTLRICLLLDCSEHKVPSCLKFFDFSTKVKTSEVVYKSGKGKKFQISGYLILTVVKKQICLDVETPASAKNC